MIRAGEWDTKTELEQIPHQDRSIHKIIVHEKYYAGALHNDIALIFLNEKFILRDNVGTACLPSQGYLLHSERCYVSGWGKNVTSMYIINKILIIIYIKNVLYLVFEVLNISLCEKIEKNNEYLPTKE